MSRRRTKYALLTGALLACVTGACGIAIALADTYSVRLDATATRAHSLEERTARLIENLDGEHELVLRADMSGVPDAAMDALADLLDAMDSSSDNLRVSVIETREQLADLISRLARRDGAEVQSHREAIESATRYVRATVAAAAALETALRERESPDQAVQAQLDAGAASMARASTELSDVAASIAALRDTAYPGGPLPEADKAIEALDTPGAALVDSLNALDRDIRELRQNAAHEGDEETAIWASTVLGASERVRTEIQRASDALRGVEPLEAVRIARAIEQTEIILLIGPEQTSALSVRALVPPQGASGADGVRIVREGEALLATALATAAVEAPPIVVLVHGANQRLIGQDGRPVPELEPNYSALFDLLAQRRIGIAEWGVTMKQPMPDRATLDPTGKRPIVWMSTALPTPGTPDRYSRTIEVASALKRLVNLGESVLLTLPPSDAEQLGEADAIGAIALEFGLRVDTARPIIRADDEGLFVVQDVRTTAPGSALAPSIEGLPTLLVLPVPISTLDPLPAGVTAQPVLTIPDRDDTWGESRWVGLIYANGTPPTPEPDPARDALDGPYTVVAAASRTRSASEASPTIDGAQRIVVVTGRDEWFASGPLTSERLIDGVPSLRYPGNSALLDASISYLAGLDELLSREARTPDVARIGQITPGELFALRLALIAGLPLGVLLIGGAWRLARR